MEEIKLIDEVIKFKEKEIKKLKNIKTKFIKLKKKKKELES